MADIRRNRWIEQWVLALAVLSLLSCSDPALLPLDQDISVSFKTNQDLQRLRPWWGSARQSYTLDEAELRSRPNSTPPVRIEVIFDSKAGVDNQFATLIPLEKDIDGRQIKQIKFGVKADFTLTERRTETLPTLEVGFKANDDKRAPITAGTFPLPLQTRWSYITIPVDPELAHLNSIGALFIKIWAGANARAIDGKAIIWLDNIVLVGNPKD